jgi:GNAT superfamily N-acetyltransferase
MIFCANKCAISGLCTSASALRDEHDPAIFLIVVSVIASEAKQSIARQGKYGLLRFAGNDGQISAGSPAMTDFSIRTMRPDEISLAVDWAAAEGWNPGHADDACFASVDREGFFIGELDGAPAATVSCVNYDASFAFLGFYIVRADLRGRGYGMRIWNAAIAHAGARVIGLDGVTAQQDNYKKSGFQLAYANVRYGGKAAARAARRADVIALSNVPFAAVEADDATVFPAPRSAFLRTWIGAPGHVGCALMRDGRLAGWGVIRPCRKGFKIGPLVADDRGTAEAVLSALLAKVGGGEIFLDVPDINREAIALAEDFGLAPVFETARMYTGAIPPLRLQRVFGVTSFELG